MYITEDNIRLKATLDMPAENPEKCPLVIIIHGFTGYSEERHIAGAARVMNEKGYATLRVDMYGHGGSDGRFYDHTLFKWLTNAMTIIDYARKLPFVTDLYLCGHSQGGLLTMLIGGMFPDAFKAILPISPAWMIPELARNGTLLGLSFDPLHIPDVLQSWDRELSGDYCRVAQTIHVEDEIERYQGKVFIIHGDADDTVPYAYAEKALALYHDAVLVPVHGDDHCFTRHLPEMKDALKSFFLDEANKEN